jgi:hypothetical protein
MKSFTCIFVSIILNITYSYSESDLKNRISSEISEITLSGSSQTEVSFNTKLKERIFEDWTEMSLRYKSLEFYLRYEAHLPPQSYSKDTSGQGIYQRTLTFNYHGITLKAGNFYSLFGNGITLRSFENRPLRWDTNIDGVYLNFSKSKVDFTFLAGRQRDLSGIRTAPLQGVELKFKPFNSWQIGASGVVTSFRNGIIDSVAQRTIIDDSKNKDNTFWTSIYSKWTSSLVTLNGEFAVRDTFFKTVKTKSKLENSAIYLSSNLFLGSVSLTGEFKRYDRFDLSNKVTYNNPPPCFKEYQYALPNRLLLISVPNDESGYFFEIAAPLFSNYIIYLDYSRTMNLSYSQVKYEDISGSADFELPFNITGNAMAGFQRDLESNNVNFAIMGGLPIVNDLSVKGSFEHQHRTIRLSQRKYYNQIYSLSLTPSSALTISGTVEHTSETGYDPADTRKLHRFWVGGQIDYSFLEKFNATIFAGSRKKGKVCSGGFCVEKPEFDGVEMQLEMRF